MKGLTLDAANAPLPGLLPSAAPLEGEEPKSAVGAPLNTLTLKPALLPNGAPVGVLPNMAPGPAGEPNTPPGAAGDPNTPPAPAAPPNTAAPGDPKGADGVK